MQKIVIYLQTLPGRTERIVFPETKKNSSRYIFLYSAPLIAIRTNLYILQSTDYCIVRTKILLYYTITAAGIKYVDNSMIFYRCTVYMLLGMYGLSKSCDRLTFEHHVSVGSCAASRCIDRAVCSPSCPALVDKKNTLRTVVGSAHTRRVASAATHSPLRHHCAPHPSVLTVLL